MSCAALNLVFSPAIMRKQKSLQDQIVIEFPGRQPNPASNNRIDAIDRSEQVIAASHVPVRALDQNYDVVLSGSYRKDFRGLQNAYEELRDLGCTVLSPSNVSAVLERAGFVYMQGEETETAEKIEERHLRAIQNAHFVWLHAPDGYVGPSAALEIGFAKAIGIRVFSRVAPKDETMKAFVEVVDSPLRVTTELQSSTWPSPIPAVRAFQKYYERIAIERGYSSESARDCLLLMVEEVGELARAIRKREGIARHTKDVQSEAQELADVFLYVIHMANILQLDLDDIVQEKERINASRFLQLSR